MIETRRFPVIVPKLEFELRVAVAVADQRHVVERLLSPRAEDGLIMQLGVLRHVLKSAPDAVTADLLRHGTQAQWWPVVEARFKATLMAQMFEWAFRMKADADRKLAEAKKNPTKVCRDLAEADIQRADYLRGVDPRPGSDGPEKRLAEFFENTSDISLAVATDGQHQLRGPRVELLAELHADRLCMEAIAPWLGLPPDEQEKRYREAVRVCEGSAYAHRSLGQHLRHFGKVDEAILHLRRSVELNPANEEGREWLLLVHAERGDYAEMLALTTERASSPMLRALRAVALLRTGDMTGAEKLARAVESIRDSPLGCGFSPSAFAPKAKNGRLASWRRRPTSTSKGSAHLEGERRGLGFRAAIPVSPPGTDPDSRRTT